MQNDQQDVVSPVLSLPITRRSGGGAHGSAVAATTSHRTDARRNTQRSFSACCSTVARREPTEEAEHWEPCHQTSDDESAWRLHWEMRGKGRHEEERDHLVALNRNTWQATTRRRTTSRTCCAAGPPSWRPAASAAQREANVFTQADHQTVMQAWKEKHHGTEKQIQLQRGD